MSVLWRESYILLSLELCGTRLYFLLKDIKFIPVNCVIHENLQFDCIDSGA